MKIFTILIFTLFLMLESTLLFSQQIKTPVKKEEPKKKTGTPVSNKAQSNKQTLKISPNLKCTLKIDGESKGVIEADDVLKIELSKGSYIILAVSTENNLDKISEEYTVTEVNTEKAHKIDLLKVRDERLAKEKKTQGPKLGTINVMRDGSLQKVEQGPIDFPYFIPSKIYDGIKEYVDPFKQNPALTGTDGGEANNGRGFTFTFTRPVALGRIIKYGSPHPFDAVIEYYQNNNWVKLISIPSTGNPQTLDFNKDSNIKSNKWRYYISNYNYAGQNLYFYEIEAFEITIE